MGALVNRITLVLGGARSGKSRHAESLFTDALIAAESAGTEPPLYVATGQALDAEMAARIARHRAERGARWRTIETPVALAEALSAEEGPALVDCLTLWLTNLLLGGHDVAGRIASLEAALVSRAGPTVLVANEVGLGIVPGDALSRRFRDEAGLLNQRIAARADGVVLVTAGLPLRLK